jgi:hypothetical protein
MIGPVTKRLIEGVNIIKVYYMHVWKYYNDPPTHTLYN